MGAESQSIKCGKLKINQDNSQTQVSESQVTFGLKVQAFTMRIDVVLVCLVSSKIARFY